MDTTALSLCMDNGLPIYVFELGRRQHPARRRSASASGRSSRRRARAEGAHDRRPDPGRDPADGQVGRVDAQRVQHRPHRTRLGGAARPHQRRLLRPADAAQAARDDQRARAAPADDPAVRPELDQVDRARDPGVRPRADAVERRQGDPAADPAADRGAAQGARQGRPPPGRGRAASPCATCAATSCTT